MLVGADRLLFRVHLSEFGDDRRTLAWSCLPDALFLRTSAKFHTARHLKTTEQRSALMRRVRQKNTSAEQGVRTLLSGFGARYRLNVKKLPGSPDIANASRRKAIFVHGCFWHHHEDCPRGRVPKRNHEFWQEKFERNMARDAEKLRALRQRGYDVLVVWECELKRPVELEERLMEFWEDV